MISVSRVRWFLPFLVWVLLFSSAFGLSNAPTVSSAVSNEESFTFAVFGDNRDGDETFMDLIEKVNKDAEIELCVNTGDFVPFASVAHYKKYFKMIANLKPRVINVVGNHDVHRGGYGLYRKYIGPSYRSFDYKNAHFILLDNALSRSFNHKQFAWLKNDLEKNQKENVFVFMHKPAFDPTELFKDHIMSGRKTIEELMGVFKKYKVDYVFAGHLHGYARAKRDGIIYVIAAGAGAPLYLPRSFGGFHHYVKVRVSGNKIKDEVVMLYD